jgi:hypothetical protein
MLISKKSRRASVFIVLLALASVTLGSGTCVVVEENPYGMEPGENAEIMKEQEEEVMSESNR